MVAAISLSSTPPTPEFLLAEITELKARRERANAT
jgi:hypothetical protein